MAILQPPPGWGRDNLSQFIEVARRNTFATFVQARPVWDRLDTIDTLFRRAIEAMNNSRAWFAGFFLLRAHASYLGAVRLSTSTQFAETYMVLRGCLENALYGLFVHENLTLGPVWLRRHEDKTSKQKVRAEFRIGRMFSLVKTKDRTTGTAARSLYERTIDYGAHPNERALTSVLRQTENADSIRFDVDYLSSTPEPLALCLQTTAQVGVCSLRIFRLVIPERFTILGLSDDLDNASRGL